MLIGIIHHSIAYITVNQSANDTVITDRNLSTNFQGKL